jgi:hypothetical protein
MAVAAGELNTAEIAYASIQEVDHLSLSVSVSF